MSALDELSCREAVELTTDYLERQLEARLAGTFEEHLAACAGCQRALRHERRVVGLLGSLGSRAPAPAPALAPAPAPPPAPAPSTEEQESPAEVAGLYFKFLRAGAVAPFSALAWPLPDGHAPGAWVQARGEIGLCVAGVHACRLDDLPYWLSDELWTVELGGELVAGERKVAARRGRLVRRVARWNAETAGAFAAGCARRARDIAVEVLRARGLDAGADALAACAEPAQVAELEPPAEADEDGRRAFLYAVTAAELAGDAAGAAATAAIAAGRAHGSPAAVEAERRRQAAELARLLGIEP